MTFSAELRKYDYDRYLCSLFAKEEQRKALHILYAFNLELAKIAEIAKEPMACMVRLKWWEETINELYEGKSPAKHEVAGNLQQIIKKYNLPHENFMQILEAREMDFAEEPPKDISILEKYAAGSSSALFALALKILGSEEENIKQAVHHAAIAWCITGLLRSAYINLPKNHFTIFPLTLMEDALISKDSFGSDTFLERSKTVVEKLIGYASYHNDKSKGLLKLISSKEKNKSLPIMLITTLTNGYLKAIRKNNYDIFSQTYKYPSFLTFISLYLRGKTGLIQLSEFGVQSSVFKKLSTSSFFLHPLL